MPNTTLRDLVTGAYEAPNDDATIHRTTEKGRPTEKVTLNSVSKESVHHTKTQKDPTEDLVELDLSKDASELTLNPGGYLVWCQNTKQMWYAHSTLCLNQNFVYREDLEILMVEDLDACKSWYTERASTKEPGEYNSRKCYILDNPCNETYEVYYESNYPSLKYGYSTPKGCFVHLYPNRFHRDMAILELDDLYSNSSLKSAVELTKKQLDSDEAIIISDGAWLKGSCSSSFVYMDNESVCKQSEGFLPSDDKQAVLIAEIVGAYRALQMCFNRRKYRIRYYYDNTSILNVFRNRKTEYINEIRAYKELLQNMDYRGYTIEFIELHPKTGETRDTDNKALQFFHNGCDTACREMADIFAKDYKSFAARDTKSGSDYKDFVKQHSDKPKNHGNGYNKPKR